MVLLATKRSNFPDQLEGIFKKLDEYTSTMRRNMYCIWNTIACPITHSYEVTFSKEEICPFFEKVISGEIRLPWPVNIDQLRVAAMRHKCLPPVMEINDEEEAVAYQALLS